MSMTEDKTTFTRGGIAWESVNEADRISPKLGTHVFMWDTVTGKTSWVPLALLRNSAVDEERVTAVGAGQADEGLTQRVGESPGGFSSAAESQSVADDAPFIVAAERAAK